MVYARSQPLANQLDERYILVLGTLDLLPGLTGKGRCLTVDGITDRKTHFPCNYP